MKWKDCGCPCVSHKRENCPNPDSKKVEAYKKRKAEQDVERNTKRHQDPSKSTENVEQGFIPFADNLADQIK